MQHYLFSLCACVAFFMFILSSQAEFSCSRAHLQVSRCSFVKTGDEEFRVKPCSGSLSQCFYCTLMTRGHTKALVSPGHTQFQPDFFHWRRETVVCNICCVYASNTLSAARPYNTHTSALRLCRHMLYLHVHAGITWKKSQSDSWELFQNDFYWENYKKMYSTKLTVSHSICSELTPPKKYYNSRCLFVRFLLHSKSFTSDKVVKST